jgi:pimeloyl-ACP methyl ester carboxylesterase
MFRPGKSLLVPVLILWLIGISTSWAQQSIQGAHYESHVPGKPRVIIFVHGFTGNSDTSWRAANGASFPSLVATDDRIKQANVFVASYDTHWLEENSTIAKLADKVFEQLDNLRVVSDHNEVIFVCHSLGGLVVERMLIEHPEIAAKTVFIQFYGTPHEGAFSEVGNPIASFIAAYGNNHVIPELRAGSGNKVLVQLDQDWKDKRLSSIHRFCAIEANPTHLPQMPAFSGIVVPYFSGAYGCDSNVPIDIVFADHIGMIKPLDRSGKDSQAYVIFLRNYRDNPYYEARAVNDTTRDFKEYLQVDCEHTKSGNDPVTFSLNPSYNEELLNASARLDDASNIKDVNPNPPAVAIVSRDSVSVSYGFNGLDKNLGNCPGGGHAMLVVHPTFQAHVPVPDGQ